MESKKFKRSLKLVPVSEEHYEFIRKLRMDERTQSSFIEKADITDAEQRDYMARHSKDYYICLSGNQALGYAGVIDSDIRICTDPEHQGKGVGSFMLAQIKKMYPHAVGRIKKSNLASQKIFQKSEVYFNLID